MEVDFVDLGTAAELAGITEARMRARLLTQEACGLVHIHDLLVVGDNENQFLPPWSKEDFPLNTWHDIGCDIYPSDFDDEIGRNPRYWLSGWVMINGHLTAELLHGRSVELGGQELWIVSRFARPGPLPYVLFAVPANDDRGPKSVPILTPSELFFVKDSAPLVAPALPTSRSRRDSSLLRIVGAMKELLLSKDGGNFPSQAKIIDVLVTRNAGAEGLSARNLEKVFKQATDALRG